MHSQYTFFIAVFLLISVGFAHSVPALTSSVPKVKLVEAFPGLNDLKPNPVDLFYFKGRFYLPIQNGEIYTFLPEKTDSGDYDMQLFANFTDLVYHTPFSELGLLGMEMHPTDQRFFIYYTVNDSSLHTVLSSFAYIDAKQAAGVETQVKILEIEQPYLTQKGGCLVFGPDGYLYISVGDGGYENKTVQDPLNKSQDKSSYLGSILRINVDVITDSKNYSIPEDNPFFSGAEGLPEIYAYGVRNTFQMTFDNQTGKLWSGDVGASDYEEVNIIEKGGNYGWSIMEGNSCYRKPETCDVCDTTCNGPLEAPFYTYEHTDGDSSITGGFVYRGSAIPKLQGYYVFADFMSGRIRAIHTESKAVYQLTTGGYVVAFAQDNANELYITNYLTGEIRKLVSNSRDGSAGILSMNMIAATMLACAVLLINIL